MILLDTHVLLWLAGAPTSLSKTAGAAIKSAVARDGVAISAISYFEIAWLASRSRIDFTGTVAGFVERVTSRCTVIPITSEIAVTAAQLPSTYPRDPADRLIGATAIVHGLQLITKDARILRSRAISAIW